MQTQIMKWFDMEAPIFAFSHCRDVVAAVSRNGGVGVLGTTRITADELEVELDWIDDHCEGRPYGVDVMFPSNAPKEFENLTPARARELIPQGHWDFMDDVLRQHRLPVADRAEKDRILEYYLQTRVRTFKEAEKRLEIVYAHPKARLIASALGVPPAHQIERAHGLGLKVGALVGHPKHVKRHKAAGVDFLVSAGYEAGGHTGDIATFVLTPQVVEEAAPMPVLHAGGVARGRQIAAAMALGAQGVWCGTVWLGTAEAETTPLEKELLFGGSSGDTRRSTSGTGKPVRRYRGGFLRAWEAEDAPKPLPMPLQSILTEEAFQKMEKLQPKDMISPAAGQVIGMMNAENDVRGVIYDMLVEFTETMESMGAFVGE